MNIPQTYVVEKFYQFAGYPRYKKSSNTYEGGCSICKEGSSWGRKRRLYYMPDKSAICCHNCGWYGSAWRWVSEVAHLSYDEIRSEITANEFNLIDIKSLSVNNSQLEKSSEPLPKDSINLSSPQQVEYYKDDQMVTKAVRYINSRRLNKAVNRPPSMYISLTDFVHKNRLCIPSTNSDHSVSYYQTRSLLDDGSPKYLSKQYAERDVYGISGITDIYPNVYIFEGPLDSFFVDNSVAIYGIQEKSKQSLTVAQHEALSNLFYMNKVWVLDNQHIDNASREKSKLLLDRGESVFIWPRSLTEFKDFNELCMHHRLNEISHKFIDSNVYTGSDAKLKLI